MVDLSKIDKIRIFDENDENLSRSKITKNHPKCVFAMPYTV